MTISVFPGRFQPFTLGHKRIIKKKAKYSKNTFIVVINSTKSIVANTGRRLRSSGSNVTLDKDVESWEKTAQRDVERREKGNKGKLPSKILSKKTNKITPANLKKIEKEKESNPFSGVYRKKLIYKSFNGRVPRENILSYFESNAEEFVKKILSTGKNPDKIIIHCGEDRARDYIRQAERMNNSGEYNFKVEVDVLERDPDSESGTKVREAIKNNDFETFSKMVPSSIHDEFDKMRNILLTESMNKYTKKILNEMVHIEDLKIDEFIDFVKNIYQTEASIKLDGTTALGFGFDRKGFFTGFGRDFRQIKPEKRKYSVEDWLESKTIIINSAVSTHKLLEQNQEKFVDLIEDEEIILSEVLFGDKPNSIKYDFGGINHLVVLNNDKVADALTGEYSLDVPNYVIQGDDNIIIKQIPQKWKVDKTQTVNPEDFNIDIESELQELQNFLEAKTQGMKNFDILKMRAAGKKKELVQDVRKKARDMKLNIKEKLLKDFVRNVRGGEYSPAEGYSHEGIVLKKGNKRTKIIDKNVFTRIHDRDWAPVKAANEIKKKMMPDDAIKEINKMIENFDTIYPDVDNITKQKMVNNLKMTKIELRELQ